MKKTIPAQQKPQSTTVKIHSVIPTDNNVCCFNFRYFKTKSISQKDFNNHFKDESHYQCVIDSFLGTILPTISNMTTTELVSGGRFSQQFHFHKVDRSKYDRIRTILQAYMFNDEQIKQFLDGENIYQFTGNLAGHDVESRIICEFINGIIYVLFFDTNHHLYLDKSKTGESFSFSYCPFESNHTCYYSINCFAKSFLDFDKINETYGYSYSKPQNS